MKKLGNLKKYNILSNKNICVSISVVLLTAICISAFTFSQNTNNVFNNLVVTKNPVIGCTGVSIDIQKSFAIDEVPIDYISLSEIETETSTKVNKNENYKKPEKEPQKIEKPKKVEEPKTQNTTVAKESPKSRTVTYDPSLTVENSNYSVVKALGEYKLTFYCACKSCCGKDPSNKWYGITATGTTATEGRTIAVDPRYIPYGTKIFIDGFGYFVAEDCGGAIKNERIDVFITTHQRALQLGRKTANIYIVE